MDGAISTSGGRETLYFDRYALPLIQGHNKEVHCKTGDAVITRSNCYGQLMTLFVIHDIKATPKRGMQSFATHTEHH